MVTNNYNVFLIKLDLSYHKGINKLIVQDIDDSLNHLKVNWIYVNVNNVYDDHIYDTNGRISEIDYNISLENNLDGEVNLLEVLAPENDKKDRIIELAIGAVYDKLWASNCISKLSVKITLKGNWIDLNVIVHNS